MSDLRLLGATGDDDRVHLFDPQNNEPYAVCGARITVLHVNLEHDQWSTLDGRCEECDQAVTSSDAQARMNEAMLHGQSFMMGHGDRNQ
jgi:hypothetical protein